MQSQYPRITQEQSLTDWRSNNASASSSSTLIGDYIGIESCLDLKDNHDDTFFKDTDHQQRLNLLRRKRDQRCSPKVKKEFPPPIPLLARTGNLPGHMPWVLKRYYTSDGRLILKEERVKHHDYFRAHRSNGRLTLHLISLDHQVYNSPSEVVNEVNLENEKEKENEIENCHSEEEEEEDDRIEKCCSEEVKEKENECEEETQVNENGGAKEDEFENMKKKEIVYDEEDERVASSIENGGSIGGTVSGLKCFNYILRPGSTCIFEMPVPTLRPIHS
ncbi:uncharacterized protein LOC126681699 [Mercurialis annua]|uniref:uncharacterized protein LOC126681699 n=1 Tax=Mercurialis annua TaxID=3986 RepID=UPI002160530C|nr:uncharacterized protein LOC126681699 [Mercurialis annua]XP_050233215.1 uncharacterized protein LOC126681699 [Mercurialis annua]